MSHLGPEAMRRILGGEGGLQEVETAAEHLVSCDPCRALAGTVADELRPENPELAGEGPLRLRGRPGGAERPPAISERPLEAPRGRGPGGRFPIAEGIDGWRICRS
jgi:hypothetical protein